MVGDPLFRTYGMVVAERLLVLGSFYHEAILVRCTDAYMHTLVRSFSFFEAPLGFKSYAKKYVNYS